ncbi:EAL domain-containing protein [Psychrobacillus sp. NPDC093200]|uniref:sensor domain-containing protein n=1 Tax=Psychrobacillus sp. NPDC093200 TaxID=3390656 RepID=UPI003CFE60C6
MYLQAKELDLSEAVLNHIPYPTFLTDQDGLIVWWSDEAEKHFGYTSEEVKGVRLPFFNDYTLGHLSAKWEKIMTKEEPIRINPVTLYTKDQQLLKTTLIAKSLSINNATYALFQLDSDRINDTDQTASFELDLLKKALSQSFMVLYLDKEGLIMHANDLFLKKSNWTPKRIIGKSFWQLFPNTPEHIAVADEVMNCIQRGNTYQGTVEKMTKDGTNYWVELLAIPITDIENNTLYYLLLEEEVTEKKLLQSRLEEIAYVDAETGLMSRHRLEEVVNEHIEERKNFSFVFISINHFYTLKEILDVETESLLMVELTKRLKIYFEDSIIARAGRDDFAIITPLSDWYIEGFIHFLKQNPIYLENKAIPITVSGAITKFPEDQQTYLHLLKATNTTLQKVKLEGGGIISSLSQSDHHKLTRTLQIEKRLIEALNHNDFHVMYLPQRNVATGKVTSVEALVRWKDEVLGVIHPDELIPIAEETGLINDIGTFMLEKACQQAAIWQQKGLGIKVSYNSSIREFRDKNMVKTVRSVLKKYNCPSDLIQIEFTEKFALEAEAEKKIIQQMQTLNQEGITFALDDFGTGYASLRYLQLLPIGKLKIDKSFVSSIMQQKKLQQLIQGLIHFGQSLDVIVVAEGVETKDQFNLLSEMGCDAVQGYFISEPITAEEVERLIMLNEV